MRLLNTGDAVGSVKSTHTFSVTESGEKEGYHVLRAACEEIQQLENTGLILKDVLMQLPDSSLVVVDKVVVKFKFVITPDGATMFKLCDGAAGGNSETKCPICQTCNLGHGDAAAHCQNIGFVCQMYTIDDADLTFEGLCQRSGISFKQLCSLNTASANLSMADGGLKELTISGPGGTTFNREDSHIIDAARIGDARQKILGHSAIRTKGGSQVNGKPKLRARIAAFSARPIISQLSDHGMKWDHICLCATHGVTHCTVTHLNSMF